MKKVLEVTAIIISGLFIFFLITQLPNFFDTQKDYHFSDEQLRQKALSLNIKPVPKTFDELLKIIDNPNNPMSLKKIILGKELFNEKALSLNMDISCASCHKLNEGGDDNLSTAIGHKNQVNPFHLNTPTVLNSALAFRLFWNARAKDVEEQAGGPIQAPFEMNMTPFEVEQRLKLMPHYVKAFENVFNAPITFLNVQNAIGAYERTLLTRGALDEFLEGNDNAISQKAKRGMTTFITKGCKGCHTGMSVGGQSIQKFPLKSWWNEWLNIKMIENENSVLPTFKRVDTTFPFENIGGFKGKDNNQRFRVPILRNISKTAPYFHNGSVKELNEAVRIMGKYQLGIEFSQEEIDELVEFLKTLEGNVVEYQLK